MSTIKICALGGLGEKGKNLYVVEVDDKIFILDAGIKYPSVDLYGIDSVIPDMTYIEKNKHKVQGIFLSHGHDEFIGAMPELLKRLNVSVYGTRFTMEILEAELVEAGLSLENFKLYKINPFKDMMFGNIKVSFFNTTHSIPESIGVCIHTKDGLIVYAADYTFNQNVGKKYKTSFDKIAKYQQEGVLCFLGDCLGAELLGDDSRNYRLQHTLSRLFAASQKRIIITTFSTDLVQLQLVLDTAKEFNKKIAILGRKTQVAVDKALNLGYLDIPKGQLVNLKFIEADKDNNIEDLVVIIAGDRHEPFHMLQRMNRKVDKLIHLEKTDKVITLTPPVEGTEKMASRTYDALSRNDIDVEIIPKDLIPPMNATKEDIKLMLELLKPKVVVPIGGEYRHQYAMKNVALDFGYQDKDVLIMDIGRQMTFEDGVLMNTSTKVPAGDLLIDGSVVGDINSVVLKDRELLAQDGVFLAVATINSSEMKLVCKPEIVSRGFAYMKSNQELIDEVISIFENTVNKNFKLMKFDVTDVKNEIRENIAKYLFKETKRKPIVIIQLVESK